MCRGLGLGCQATRQQLSQPSRGHLESAGLGVTTAAHAAGQRNAVKARLRAQADFDHTTLFVRSGISHQRKAAARLGQQLTHQAVEHTGRVDHQPGNAIKNHWLRVLGDIGG